MKRLIVGGAVLLGCFSSIVTGCGSRSSDTDYLPAAPAGESGLGASAGSGISTGGSSAAGVTSAAGASGFANAAGASSTGGAHFAGAGGTVGTAGGPITGGSGAASGASFGGAAAGGASIGGAATGGSSTGGAAVGGATSTGGSSGVSGAGGGNSALCPVALPNNNGMCSTAALQCNYTGRSCACRARGNTLAWRCTGSGNACPGTEPTAATACAGTLQCPYPDGNQCNCGASGQWNCFTAGCPASKPVPSGSCGSVFGQCTYGTGAGSACVCVAGGWFCN